MFKSALLPLMLSFSFACLTAAAQTIKETPIQMTSPASGAEMFKAYCAACHGIEGKGNGPAASALKKAPTDLSELAKNNGGKYPELTVVIAIKGDAAIASHGSIDMPVWGRLFRDTVSHGDQGEVQLRISNLASYIKTLQVK